MAEASKTAKTKTKAPETKEKQVKRAEAVAETLPLEAAPEAKIEVEKVTAKAGKRSAKSLKETEVKEVKQARKAEKDTAEAVKAKPAVKPARSKQERAGKKYREAAKLIDKSKQYSLADALELAAKTSPTKFDAAIELHINLGVDPKQADQNIRDNVVLPAGTGKTIRVAALVEADSVAAAKTAGADVAGIEEIFDELDKENIAFDVLVAQPSLMPRLGKYARLLGPRGLMPNPKSGTVTQDAATAVKEAKAGRVEYRVDQAGIVHLGIGKASFGKDKLRQNAEAVMSSIRAAKPSSLKGNYINSIFVTSSMGPSIKVDTAA